MRNYPIIIIRHNPEVLGGIEYYVEASADVRVFVVDERCPNDRVYELTQRFERAELLGMIGESEIGHAGDARHKAVTNRINAAVDGKPHLRSVDE